MVQEHCVFSSRTWSLSILIHFPCHPHITSHSPPPHPRPFPNFGGPIPTIPLSQYRPLSTGTSGWWGWDPLHPLSSHPFPWRPPPLVSVQACHGSPGGGGGGHGWGGWLCWAGERWTVVSQQIHHWSLILIRPLVDSSQPNPDSLTFNKPSLHRPTSEFLWGFLEIFLEFFFRIFLEFFFSFFGMTQLFWSLIFSFLYVFWNLIFTWLLSSI